MPIEVRMYKLKKEIKHFHLNEFREKMLLKFTCANVEIIADGCPLESDALSCRFDMNA
jgi:hypothetical protein